MSILKNCFIHREQLALTFYILILTLSLLLSLQEITKMLNKIES